MSNDNNHDHNNHRNHNNNNNTRSLPFPHSFNIGTTIQNVFRNINHTFTSNRDSTSGQHRNDELRHPTSDMPPPEPLNLAHDIHPTHTAIPLSSSPTPDPSISTASTPPDIDMPPSSQPDSRRDDDGDSMPELRSVSDSSDESDADIATIINPVPSHQNAHPVDEHRDNVQMDDEDEPPSLEPITGTRRARVDDDGDDARDRRHPSERVGAPPAGVAPQPADPQQPPHLAGLFGALFGHNPPGPNFFREDAPPPDAPQTGEGSADPSPTGNNATPGHPPRDVPFLTAGFTLTIPLFGPPPGNHTGVPADGQGQGPPPGLFNMDPAAREALFASFAAFFQEFQAMEEAREDPERAKKLVAGLEVVPLGLVKRLERVGGAPGGHVGDANAEGTSSGCAICWDTLLDGESDNFTTQFAAGEASSSGSDTVEGQDTAHTDRSEVMDVEAPSTSLSHSEAGTSVPTPQSSEEVKIISLPCAHVFHASCLLPWFTRAKQATCPTCRFNIDPENLTYTPLPRRTFNRPPTQPGDGVPNPAPVGPQGAPEAPAVHVADAAVPPPPATAGVPPATAAIPPGAVPPFTGLAGGMPAGFNPFMSIPGIPIPILSIPGIQIPVRPAGAQAPEGGNQGIDVLTIGLDMFVGGLPPGEQGADPRGNPEGVNAADNGEADTGAAGAGANDAANPNGPAGDLQSLIEGLLRTTRNIIPQAMNAQANAPPPAPASDGPHANDAQPQPQAGPAPNAAGPHPDPPLAGGPRVVPTFPFRPMMFRPTRPMPPLRERKIWTPPPAPGPSLRQRVEQREREQGLRCSDTSCGVGPSDDDPYPEPSSSLTKQVFIHPRLSAGEYAGDVHASVCTHTFHPACLVSAERVKGWGGEDETESLVEVSCPKCRAVGCVTREEWNSGVSAL